MRLRPLRTWISPAQLLVLSLLAPLLFGPAAAQEHIATRLGDPATRFAKPREKPEDVRSLLRSEAMRNDVALILNLGGWKGDLEDLRRAAADAEITEMEFPKGSRIAYMSTRKNGRPEILKDLLWAGAEPFPAYAFHFESKGRRYKMVMPKPCSNFWVEDAGELPPPAPGLALLKTGAAESGLCDPLFYTLLVTNTGNIPLTQVKLTDTLPAGLKTTDGRTTVEFEAGTLRPAQAREFKFNLAATAAGRYENKAHAAAAEGVTADATAVTVVHAPVLTMVCRAPPQGFANRPLNVCLTVRNTGDATEELVGLALPIPPGAKFNSATEGGRSSGTQIVWEFANMPAGDQKEICASFTFSEFGTMAFAATARGTCAGLVESGCQSKIAGIPAILLEVIDEVDPIEVGQTVTYVIKVTNQGSAAGTHIKLVCTLEAAQEFISGTGPTPVKADGKTLTLEALPRLEPKAEAIWRLSIKAAAAGDVRFAVDLSSDQFDRPIHETEATQQY